MLIIDRVDISGDERLSALVRVLREVSTEREPPKVIAAFGPWLGQRIDRDFFISVSRRGLPEGEYKITRAFGGEVLLEMRQQMLEAPATTRAAGRGVAAPENEREPANPWRDWKSLAAHRGGLIGGVLERDAPQTMRLSGLEHDPVLGPIMGDAARHLRSALAMPTFDEGEALNWSIAFSRDPDGFPPEVIENAFLDLNMIGTATRNLVALKQVGELNAQLESQFQQIARIQQSLLPRKLPRVRNFELAASYLTSTVAGGDYYDFFPFPDGRWGVLIADVAGHGPSAACVMAMLRAILHCYETDAPTPAQMLDYANQKLFEAKLEGTFVTAFMGLIDPDTGAMTWSSCGHTPAKIKHADGTLGVLDSVGNLPLGVLLGESIDTAEFTFKPGDTLVLYTDGISESFNSNRKMFGVAGIEAALAACPGNPQCVVDGIHEGIYRHTRGLARDDDQTLVVMQFLPEGWSVPATPPAGGP